MRLYATILLILSMATAYAQKYKLGTHADVNPFQEIGYESSTTDYNGRDVRYFKDQDFFVQQIVKLRKDNTKIYAEDGEVRFFNSDRYFTLWSIQQGSYDGESGLWAQIDLANNGPGPYFVPLRQIEDAQPAYDAERDKNYEKEQQWRKVIQADARDNPVISDIFMSLYALLFVGAIVYFSNNTRAISLRLNGSPMLGWAPFFIFLFIGFFGLMIGVRGVGYTLVLLIGGPLLLHIILAFSFGGKIDKHIADYEVEKKKDEIRDAYGVKDWAFPFQIEYATRHWQRGLNIINGIQWADEGHIMTCATTRSGKGFYLIAPALTDDHLQAYDAPSFVVLDPKGENLMISGEYLKRIGYDVHCINPFEIDGLQQFGQSGFNPLADLDYNDPDIDDHIDTIAYSIIPHSNHKDKFFDNAARDLIVNIIRHLITQTKYEVSFGTLYRKVLESSTDDFLIEMGMNPAFDGMLESYAKKIISQKHGDTWKSVQASAETAMALFSRRRLSQSLSGSSFSMDGIGTNKTAVFLCVPPEMLKSNAPWIRIFFSSMLRQMQKNYRPVRKTVIILDEFIQLGYMDEVRTFMRVGAHYATIWTVIQDLDALSKLYDDWQSFIANSRIKHWFASDDNFTCEYVSKRMPMTIEFVGSNADGSPKEIQKPLLRPDEVRYFGDIILEMPGLDSPARMPKISYLQQNNNGRDLRAGRS